MKILGINSVFHESSAALVVDGEIVAACEEERFSRVKHAKQARVDNPHELPEKSIRFCLDYAEMRPRDIDRVAYSFDPGLRRATFCAEWWPDTRWESEFLRRLDDVASAAEAILDRELGDALTFVPHHLAHAASAFYPSGFDSAAILVVDGIGESACSSLARGDGAHIRCLDALSYPHSLGFVWEQVSLHLGFSPYDAAKVMGLAAYGDPNVFREQIASIVFVRDDDYSVDPLALGFPPVDRAATMRLDAGGLECRLGPRRRATDEIVPRHAHIAAALQAETNAAVAALLRRLERAVDGERLCVAGGVALNCVTNSLIAQMSGFSDVFIPSAPHDAGTAIGAALAAHCADTDAPPRPSATPYLGPAFDEREILAAVRAAGFTPRRSDDPAREAADLIADGNIVAWFQGRMEFGPRALGNRSLLADPRRRDTRAIINQRIKHREDFRPFGPAVLAERAGEWFDIASPSPSHEFMLFAFATKAERRERIPAVVHHDGTARVQLVRSESNPRFHRLISHFFERTGVPLVLNTSFNDNEPIVCTPAQAIETFRSTGMDALFMGDVYLTSQT